MLTENQIKAALRGGKDTLLNDGAGGRGTGSLVLVIRSGATGPNAQWFGKWKRDGRIIKLGLGRYPAMSLKDARERFGRDVRDVLVAGGNPRTAARTADAPTVDRLFRSYVDGMKAAGKTSWQAVEYALLTGQHAAADAFGRDALAGDVTSNDVAAYLGTAYKRGARVTADRTRAYLSAAFNWGIKAENDYTAERREDWGIKANPAAMVRRDMAANKARERNLTADELRAVWFGLDGKGFASETTAAARLLIACGQRARETLRLEGREIDFKAATWTMPAAKTKGRKRAHIVPLPACAIDVLRPLVDQYGDGPLFPPQNRSQGAHMTDGAISRAVARLVASSDLEPFQPRDLRRTWKSRAADAGVDRFTRDLIQQHAQGDTGSKHYDRADYLPQMREAMDKWQAWLQANVLNKKNPV